MHFTLFQSDLSHDMSKPLVKVLCSTKRLDDLDAESLFKENSVVATRTFNGLECFVFMNPGKESAGMTPHEIE